MKVSNSRNINSNSRNIVGCRILKVHGQENRVVSTYNEVGEQVPNNDFVLLLHFVKSNGILETNRYDVYVTTLDHTVYFPR